MKRNDMFKVFSRQVCTWSFVAVYLVVAPIAALGQGQGEYTLNEWMSVKEANSFLWSPEGEYFYYTSTSGSSETTEIFRIPSNGGDPVQLSTNPSDVQPEPKKNIALSADGETLFFAAAPYFGGYDNIYRMPASGGSAQALTFHNARIQTDPAPQPGGDMLAYFARLRQEAGIFFLDQEEPNGWPRPFALDKNERSPVWSPDGEKLLFSRGGALWISDLAEDTTSKKLIEDAYAGGNGSPVWSPDGNQVAFTRGESGYSQIGVVEVSTGEVTPITYDASRSHSHVSWSPDGEWLTFVRSDKKGLSRHVVMARANGTGQIKKLTQGKGIRSSPKFSPDGNRIAYLETTDTRTTDIWTIPSQGGSPTPVTNSMGQIDPSDMSVPEEVTYSGPGNLQIPTLLYKPANFDPDKKYPAIVRLHGHPTQWNHSFHMMWQYFLQKGFVIIAPNPRGSVGFGQGFHDLHIADWGGDAFADIMGAVDYLRKLPYVDMSRKATWGGSGGGYKSLVISTKAPDMFQAQVIRAPVSSWKLLAIDRYGAVGRAWKANRTPVRKRVDMMGSYDEIPREYISRSPIHFVEDVQVPQLLFQGLQDSSVPPRQAQIWAKRMCELGKGDLITYVEYPNEDHGLTRYRTTVRNRLIRMQNFFSEHLRLPELAELSAQETAYGSPVSCSDLHIRTDYIKTAR